VRHPSIETVWVVSQGGRHRCVGEPGQSVCIHELPLLWTCEACAVDWIDYCTNNGGL